MLNVAPSLTIFNPAQIAARVQNLNLLADKWPVLVPIPVCCKFMHISDEGLRRAILKKQVPGAFWWRKLNKQNYAYRIQTLPLYDWYIDNLLILFHAAQKTPCCITEDGNKIFERPPSILQRVADLRQLIFENPISIPVAACASFMEISAEGLRCAIQLDNIPGSLFWKQAGKSNYAYSIQAIPFAAWEVAAQARSPYLRQRRVSTVK